MKGPEYSLHGNATGTSAGCNDQSYWEKGTNVQLDIFATPNWTRNKIKLRSCSSGTSFPH